MKDTERFCLKISLILFFSINTENIHTVIYECVDASHLGKIQKIATPDSLVIFHDHILIKPETFFNPRFDIYHKFINYFLDKIGIKTNTQIDEFMAKALINSQPKINLIAKQTIDSLRANNIKAFAISNSKTGQWHAIKSKEDFRINKLNNCGFNFSFAINVPHMHFILNEQDPANSPFLKNGIIFTNNNPEESVLHAFFNYAQKQITPIPRKIIYIDNDLEVLREAEQTFTPNYPQTEFIGIYYPINKPLLESCWFDILKFKTQIAMFKELNQWFSDEVILEKVQNWTPDQKNKFEHSVTLFSSQYKEVYDFEPISKIYPN